MITEDYVSFETAKLLKERGFDESCGYYKPDGEYWDYRIYNHSNPNWFSAPTIQMAMKWLREVHNEIVNVWFDGERWVCEHYRRKYDDFTLIGYRGSYEEACDTAIRYCLELLPSVRIYEKPLE